MFLAEQRQRADGLHDVVFHPVVRRWRNESPDRRRRESPSSAPGRDALPRVRPMRCSRLCHLIKTSGKQFGQPQVRADGNQAVGESVQTFKRDRAALLRRNRAFLVALSRLGATTADSNCDSRARIRQRAKAELSLVAVARTNSVPKIGLMPARFAACANSTAPCRPARFEPVLLRSIARRFSVQCPATTYSAGSEEIAFPVRPGSRVAEGLAHGSKHPTFNDGAVAAVSLQPVGRLRGHQRCRAAGGRSGDAAGGGRAGDRTHGGFDQPDGTFRDRSVDPAEEPERLDEVVRDLDRPAAGTQTPCGNWSWTWTVP